jgi:hypothetical protein
MTFGKWIKYSFYAVLIGSPFLVLAAWKTHTDPVRRSVESSLVNDQQLVQRVGAVQDVALRKSTYVQPGILHNGERTEGYNLYDYSVKGQSSSVLIRERVAQAEQNKTDGVEYSVEYRR